MSCCPLLLALQPGNFQSTSQNPILRTKYRLATPAPFLQLCSNCLFLLACCNCIERACKHWLTVGGSHLLVRRQASRQERKTRHQSLPINNVGVIDARFVALASALIRLLTPRSVLGHPSPEALHHLCAAHSSSPLPNLNLSSHPFTIQAYIRTYACTWACPRRHLLRRIPAAARV